MRRFAWIATLLFGFSGDRYVWAARPRVSIPAMQPVRLVESDRTVRGPDWWVP